MAAASGCSGQVRFQGQIRQPAGGRPAPDRRRGTRRLRAAAATRLARAATPSHLQIVALGQSSTVAVPRRAAEPGRAGQDPDRRDALTPARLHPRRRSDGCGCREPDARGDAWRPVRAAHMAAMEAVRRAGNSCRELLGRATAGVPWGRRAWSLGAPARPWGRAPLQHLGPAGVVEEQVDAIRTRPSAAAGPLEAQHPGAAPARQLCGLWSRPCRRCAASPSGGWCWLRGRATSAASPRPAESSWRRPAAEHSSGAKVERGGSPRPATAWAGDGSGRGRLQSPLPAPGDGAISRPASRGCAAKVRVIAWKVQPPVASYCRSVGGWRRREPGRNRRDRRARWRRSPGDRVRSAAAPPPEAGPSRARQGGRRHRYDIN